MNGGKVGILLAAILWISGCGNQPGKEFVKAETENLPALPGAEALGLSVSDYESAEKLVDRGWVKNRPGSYVEASALFSEAVRRERRNAEAYIGRSYSYYKLGYWAASQEDLYEAIRLEPGHPRALNTLGWQLATHLNERYRDGDNAIEISKRAVAARPGASYVVSTLAAAYAEAGNFSEAIRLQKQAIDLEKSDTDFIGYLVELERDLALYKAGKPVRDHQMLRSLQIGRNAAISGKYDLALIELGKAAETMPENRIVYGEFGRTYFGLKRWDEAIASYKKDLSLDPLDQESYWSLAWILATHPEKDKRNGQEALILAREAVRLSERDTSYDALAAAQAETGDFTSAVQSQKTALELGRKNAGDMAIRRQRLEAYKAGEAWTSQ